MIVGILFAVVVCIYALWATVKETGIIGLFELVFAIGIGYVMVHFLIKFW